MSDSPAELPDGRAAVPAQPARRQRGDRLTLRCAAMVHGGVCLGRSDEGETVLVDGAIPGELCTVELTHRSGGTWFARVATVHQASPHRVPAPCPWFGTCGGCQLQHIAYAHQLELKRDIVADAMRRARVPLPDRISMHGMEDPWSYRWRGEFHVVREAGQVTGLGFNRVRSWHAVAVDDCLIHHPSIRSSLPLLRSLARRGGSPRLSTLHLTVGEDGDELLVRGNPRSALDSGALDDAAREAPVRLGVTATTLHWRGHSFRAEAESFIQVNWRQMDVLYSLVLQAVAERTQGVIVDAYAGIGVLSIALAEQAARVVCIEENRVSARLGLLNARVNHLADRLEYVAEAVETALPQVATGADAVVLDPPRAGCDSRVTGWLALAGPPLVVYVSCDPATLARDLRVLCGAGPYTVERLDVVDMFAQTAHVECVAVLARQDQPG